MKQTIIQKFSRSDKLKRIEVPFIVTGQIEKLVLDIQVVNNTEQDAIVDIGIRDSVRIRGWTGSNKKHLIIAEEYATPGYSPGEIIEGEWAFLLSVYKVPDEGCEVILTVNLIEKHFRWLKGDTHFHTLHSDGNGNINEFAEECKSIGFDYLISTNHNTATQNNLLPTDIEMTFIPGFELTTYHGHANLIGLKQPIKDFRCDTKLDIESKFLETKKNGGYVGINHPCADDNEGCVWAWGFDFVYDWLEVWNDSWSYMNENALKLWNSFLQEGKRIPIIGGSDNHHLTRYLNENLPVTYVYANSCSKKSILKAFCEGHVYIALKDGPYLEMIAGSEMIGDLTSETCVKFYIKNLKVNDEVILITDNGITEAIVIDSGNNIGGEFNRNTEKYFRIEIRRSNPSTGMQDVILISNPIYLK